MISSKDILKETGLKTSKTLTRWHQRGLIPVPLVRTHPSGRGKIAYWPDWVLERCARIVELQRQGHSLQSVAQLLEVESRSRSGTVGPTTYASISDFLQTQTARIGGREVSQADAFRLVMLASVTQLVTDAGERAALLAKLKDLDAVDQGLRLARAGYNPVLLYDGEELEVVPDFVVGRRLSNLVAPRRAFVVAPILPTLRQAFPGLAQLVGTGPTVWPAPKVWMEHGDRVIECVFSSGGPRGFELIDETAKIVSTMHRQAESDADPGEVNR